MREKPAAVNTEELERGITPAYAGKTTSSSVNSSPRVGSPPRMREKRL